MTAAMRLKGKSLISTFFNLKIFKLRDLQDPFLQAENENFGKPFS